MISSVERARRRIGEALENGRRSPPTPLLESIRGEIAVYGAGGMGRAVLSALVQRGRTPRCILDRGRAPGEVCGVPVYHPVENSITTQERARLTVLVAVFNPDADPVEIRTVLEQERYGRVIGFLEVHRELAPELGRRYWLTADDFYDGRDREILEAVELWADDASRDLYAAVIAGRLSRDDTLFPRPTLDDQYFPTTLPPLTAPVRLIDCGAYTGETMEEALRHGIDLAEVCAFEPDPMNFRALVGWSQARPPNARFPLYLWPCAVGRSTGVVRFRAGQGGASTVAALGESAVTCVALDDAIGDFAATLLKLDVEGAEMEALEGGDRLICSARPRLAVCVYHHPEHLWAIPSFVRKQHPAYDLHLRLHRFNAFDLVMYALPRA